MLSSRIPDQMAKQAHDLIFACLERGLGILGPTGKAASIYMLQTKYVVPPRQLVDMRSVTNGLRELFGPGSAVLLRAIRDQLRNVNSTDDEVQKSVDKAARDVEEALYGVEHGLA